jgi:hypothetical protein
VRRLEFIFRAVPAGVGSEFTDAGIRTADCADGVDGAI